MTIFAKDPSETLDYSFDWSERLAAGEVIDSSAFTVATDELVIGNPQVTGSKTTALISGGNLGHVYRVSNSIHLSSGRVEERSMIIRVMQR